MLADRITFVLVRGKWSPPTWIYVEEQRKFCGWWRCARLISIGLIN